MKTIQGYKGFVVIAWTTVILFSMFTYSLTRELSEKIDQLAPSYVITDIELD